METGAELWTQREDLGSAQGAGGLQNHFSGEKSPSFLGDWALLVRRHPSNGTSQDSARTTSLSTVPGPRGPPLTNLLGYCHSLPTQRPCAETCNYCTSHRNSSSSRQEQHF